MRNASLNPELLLARRAAKSDPQAWDEIIGLFGERIFNLCFRFAGNRPEAEDLTQEVFLKLYGHLHQYRGDVPLMAWALRLSRNLCIDYYRQHRARRECETVSAAVLEQMPAADDPRADTQLRERRRLVYETLETMAENLATVLELRDLQGLSYEEIAGFLEVPMGTVKSRLSRARKELVSRLETRLGLGGSASSPQPLQVSPC